MDQITRTEMLRNDEIDYETYAEEGEVNTGRVQKSVEGYVIVVSNIHEEAMEEDLHDTLAEYGTVRNMHLNLDRRTGFVKGYLLVEYATYQEAKDAVAGLQGTEILGNTVDADFAFAKGSVKGLKRVAPVS